MVCREVAIGADPFKEDGLIADTMTRFYRDPENHLIGGTMERVQKELEEIRCMLKSPPESDQ